MIHLPIGGWELVAGLENLGRGFGGESWGMSNPQLALDWLNAAGKFKMENGDGVHFGTMSQRIRPGQPC